MMNKGISKFLITTLSILLLVCPFSIYAEGQVLNAPFVGVNIYVTGVDQQMNHIKMPTLNFGYAGTQGTSGWISGNLACTVTGSGQCSKYNLQSENGSNNSDLQVYINLANLRLSESETWDFQTYVYYDYELEFVLDSYYVGYVNFTQGGYSHTVYVNGNTFTYKGFTDSRNNLDTIVINSYDLSLNSNQTWSFPIESFPIIKQAMDDDFVITDFYKGSSYIFPIFVAPANHRIARLWMKPNEVAYFIFGYEFNMQANSYSNYLSIENATVEEFTELYYSDHLTIKKIKLAFTGTSEAFITITNLVENDYMPIWFGNNTTYLSTEFAQRFGLTNKLLDDINLIANGNEPSNESVDDNNSSNDDLLSSANNLYSQEDSFNNSMNSNLENIDTNYSFNDLGASFLSSANWVRTQYNRLTGASPFGSVISFSLLMGLALLLIGRWRH